MSISRPEVPIEVRPGRRAVSDWALIQLQELILSGQLAAGDSLGEVELTEMLGVSRSPTSAALRQLEERGLVDVSPTNGRRTVKRFGIPDIHELYTIRLALEPLGARLAAERISDAQIRHLRTILAEGHDAAQADDTVGRLAAEFRFHALICEASGITRLAQLLTNPWLQTRASLVQFEAEGTRPAGDEVGTPGSHALILEHLANRDPGASEAALAEHLRSVRDALVEDPQLVGTRSR